MSEQQSQIANETVTDEWIKSQLELSQNTISDEDFYQLLSNPHPSWGGNMPTRNEITVDPFFKETLIPPYKKAPLIARYLSCNEFHRFKFGNTTSIGYKAFHLNQEKFMATNEYKQKIQTKNDVPSMRCKSVIVDYGKRATLNLDKSVFCGEYDEYSEAQYFASKDRVLQNFLFVTYVSDFQLKYEIECDDQVTFYNQSSSGLIPPEASFAGKSYVLKADTIWDRLHMINVRQDPRWNFGVCRVKRVVIPNWSVVQFALNIKKKQSAKTTTKFYYMQGAIFVNGKFHTDANANIPRLERARYGSCRIMYRCWPCDELMDSADDASPCWAVSERLAFMYRGRTTEELAYLKKKGTTDRIRENEEMFKIFKEHCACQIMTTPYIQQQFKRRWGMFMYNPSIAPDYVIENMGVRSTFTTSPNDQKGTLNLAVGSQFNNPVMTYAQGGLGDKGKLPLCGSAFRPFISAPFRLTHQVGENNQAFKALVRDSSMNLAGICHVGQQCPEESVFLAAITAKCATELFFNYTPSMTMNCVESKESFAEMIQLQIDYSVHATSNQDGIDKLRYVLHELSVSTDHVNGESKLDSDANHHDVKRAKVQLPVFPEYDIFGDPEESVFLTLLPNDYMLQVLVNVDSKCVENETMKIEVQNFITDSKIEVGLKQMKDVIIPTFVFKEHNLSQTMLPPRSFFLHTDFTYEDAENFGCVPINIFLQKLKKFL